MVAATPTASLKPTKIKEQCVRFKIAEAIGKPKSFRAVANACGKNPIPIIRPCHRVICSDGSIGGYSASGGTRLKSILLKIEFNSE